LIVFALRKDISSRNLKLAALVILACS